MQTKIMTIFTRTPLHVGAGSSVGAIDQPIIRERHTGFPVIPGSAIKGVLRDYAAGQKISDIKELFGKETTDDTASAGAIGFGEARLLAFPLRSAKGSFALITCPLALSRFARDANKPFTIPSVKDDESLASTAVKLDGNKVALEEYIFDVKGDFPDDWAKYLSSLLDDVVLKEAETHFVLLSDGDFSYFAKNACQVQHHNRIKDETGTAAAGALFNTETVPSETLFYSPLYAIKDDCADNELFAHFIEVERMLQFGGNGTTGLGFCTCKLG